MSKKIKILHVLPSLVTAGAERVVHDLLLGLDRERFESSLLLFKDIKANNSWREDILASKINIFSLQKKYLFDLKNFFQLLAIIKKLKPAIVHTHLGADIYGRLAAKIAGVKIIVSTEHNLNHSENFLTRLIKMITIRFAVQVFAVSRAVAKYVRHHYKMPAEKITVVYNGIDLNIFEPSVARQERKQKDAKLVIGAIGRLTEQKGFKDLIQAVSQTKASNYVVKIAGQGELEDSLRQLIKSLNLESRVELVGLVDSNKFISSLDIFVVPSRWEGLGLVVLEAGALARPIIASEVDGLKEIINPDNGYLFAAGDSLALARKIDEVIGDLQTSVMDSKIQKIRETVKNRFSLNKMIAEYSRWYEELIKNFD